MSNRMDFIYTDDEANVISLLNGESITSASGEEITMGQEDFILVPDNTEEQIATITENIITLQSEVSTATSIAKGANQSVTFESYSAMVSALNTLSNDVYNVGQNVMIVTLNVPDLWVSEIAEAAVEFTYNSEEDFTNQLSTNGYVQVGYYKLSALETQKVDLNEYAKNTDIPTITVDGVAAKTLKIYVSADGYLCIDTE